MNMQSTKDLILDSAQEFAQTRGFNGFSYADIATDVGIRKASIHHHFSTKEDLEAALMDRYHEGFMVALKSISAASTSPTSCLKKYGDLYADSLRRRVVCLGGMMASDLGALPERLAPMLRNFFKEQTEWLTQVMEQGKASGEFAYIESPGNRASMFLAAMQGGLLIGNAMDDEDAFERICEELITELRK